MPREPMTVTGWCNTGQHRQCPKEVALWGDENNIKVCTCWCHSEPEPVVEQPTRARCIVCGGEYALRKDGSLRSHQVNGAKCLGSEG